MTQDTNNQEWWEGEFEKEFLGCTTPDCARGGSLCSAHQFQEKHMGKLPQNLKDFIRKVSQQSREDALKERTEGILKRLQELSSHGVEVSYISNGETKSYVTGLGNLHIKDVEKMFERDFKLPPKQ